MGAWGYGIMQNDTAQDSMCEVAYTAEAAISELGKQPGEESAARMAAGIGILLQTSPYSFSADNPRGVDMLQTLAKNKEHFNTLPGNAGELLQAVLDGKGAELCEREGIVDADIDHALHSDEDEGFIMQRAYSVIEPDLFAHPASATYLQELIDGLVAEVDAGFDDEESVEDLSREGEFMGKFGLLLVLPKAQVDPAKFTTWRKKFQAVNEAAEIDEEEKEFYDQYYKWLELAFTCGEKRYA